MSIKTIPHTDFFGPDQTEAVEIPADKLQPFIVDGRVSHDEDITLRYLMQIVKVSQCLDDETQEVLNIDGPAYSQVAVPFKVTGEEMLKNPSPEQQRDLWECRYELARKKLQEIIESGELPHKSKVVA